MLRVCNTGTFQQLLLPDRVFDLACLAEEPAAAPGVPHWAGSSFPKTVHLEWGSNRSVKASEEPQGGCLAAPPRQVWGCGCFHVFLVPVHSSVIRGRQSPVHVPLNARVSVCTAPPGGARRHSCAWRRSRAEARWPYSSSHLGRCVLFGGWWPARLGPGMGSLSHLDFSFFETEQMWTS